MKYMIIFFLALMVLPLFGIRVRNDSKEDFLSRNQTTAIKGMFILLVIICHASGYVDDSGYNYKSILDKLFLVARGVWGQCTVVMFMFYSGYGIMESIKESGIDYIRRMPIRRILNTILNFDVAVVIFTIVNLATGRNLGTRQFILSLVALDSVGNSNWYIFIILLCYALAFVSFLISYSRSGDSSKNKNGLIFLTAASISTMLTLHFVGQPSWWYDTILAFCAGAAISQHKPKFITLVSKHYSTLLAMSILSLTAFRLLEPSQLFGIAGNLMTLSFTLVVLLITCKIKIGNPILMWMGERLFPLYIYQRLPMIVIATLNPQFIYAHPASFMAISICASFALAALYRFIKIQLR